MASLADGEAAFLQRDYERARAIWEPLVKQGHANAAAWLGSLYANGLGVEGDPATAFRYYLLAAERGNVMAANNVAVMYSRGDGTEINPERACYWLRTAAEQGDGFAQYNYAVALTTGMGMGMEIDLAAGVVWFRRAAEAGHYLSQARLGSLYARGAGVDVDRIEAFRWLSSASRHGVTQAETELQALLGAMSEEEKRIAAASAAIAPNKSLRATPELAV
jgi:hypothetical protein